MAETAWAEETGGAPKKRAIPTWAWFCGAGCLVALVLAIIAGVVIVDQMKKAFDPERQWEHLARALPHDRRPEGWEMGVGIGADLIGFKMYFLKKADAQMAIVMHLPEAEAEEVREQLFDEKHSGSLFGVGGRSDMKLGSIDVQGRTLRVMRFYQRSEGSDESREGASLMVEVTPEGEGRPIILQMIRLHVDEPYSDEEVRAFLEPFHVGPDR